MKTLALSLGLILTTLFGCAMDPPQSGEATTNQVAISGFAFQPGTAHLSVGQTVTFTNQDATNHSIQWTSVPAGASAVDSGTLGQGGSFAYTPTVAGQYNFRCGFHNGMTGTLIVGP